MREIKLELNSREFTFKLGLGFLGELLDKTGYDVGKVDEMLKSNPFKIVPLLMFYSAVYALERAGETVDFTQYDMIDWLDDEGGVNSKVSSDFLNAFTKSLTKDVPKSKAVQSKSPKKK